MDSVVFEMLTKHHSNDNASGDGVEVDFRICMWRRIMPTLTAIRSRILLELCKGGCTCQQLAVLGLASSSRTLSRKVQDDEIFLGCVLSTEMG